MFLLLTPILMLAVVALVGFVGCSFQGGSVALPAPTDLTAVSGNGSVALTWNNGSTSPADSYNVKRGTMSGGPYTTIASAPASPTAFTDTGVTNGTTYYYVITAIYSGDETDPSNEASATPTMPVAPLTTFVTSATAGTPRNMANQPFTGWAGMQMQVGGGALTIKTLGRFVAPGNTAMHALKIVDAATGVDVPNGSTTVNTAGQTAGAFIYASLPNPVTLTAGASYYVVSHEDTSTAAGDTFYDLDTTIKTTGVATVTFAIYEFDAPPGFNQTAMANPPNAFTFGPVDFQY